MLYWTILQRSVAENGPCSSERALLHATEQHGLALAQRFLNRRQPFFELHHMLEHPYPAAGIEHRVQQRALPDEPLIAANQGLQRLRGLAIALRHAVILRDRLRLQPAADRADAARQALEILGRRRDRRIRKRLLARRRGNELAPVIRLRTLYARARHADKPRRFAAHELIVRAQLVLGPVEVVAPTVKEVDRRLPEHAFIVELCAHD